jgi:hypothetical protein
VPVFYKQDSNLVENGYFGISKSRLKENTDITENFTVDYYNIKRTGINADNISFETRFKVARGNTFIRGEVNMNCEKGFVSIPIAESAASGNIFIFVSDVNIKGREEDLSAFTKSPEEFHTIYFKNRNKKTEIYLDNIKVREITYTMPLGEFYGFRFKFYGTSGFIDYVKVWDEDNVLVMNDEFEEKALFQK